VKISQSFFVLFLFLATAIYGNSSFDSFIEQQIEILDKMNEDNNVTQEQIEELVSYQEKLYEAALDEIMVNKKEYINNINLYDSNIFSLQKIININKRAGNTYAVIRDEVKIKSFLLLKAERLMLKEVLQALDKPSLKEFEKHLDDIIVANQIKVEEIYKKDYTPYLKIDSPSKTLAQAKQSIRRFYLLKEINVDTISYIYKYERKMYRLNKYTKYHLIKMVIYINNIDIVKHINPVLDDYGLNVMKIVFMLLLSIIIYFFRKIVYVALESYILKIDILSKYSKEILARLKKPIEAAIIIININMIIYVYNDFSSIDLITSIFNIIYALLFTMMFYIVVNTVATIKLSEVPTSKKQIKNELVNVGMKIINFIIVIVGILLVLHFAGVNLTAVLSGLGIGGFAVAFAARDTISNFFGTLSILFSDVFSQGDWIVVGEHEGVVVEIGLRVTTIRTFDNALIAIPNGTFANTDVKNWDRRTLGRRIKMSVGVKYDSKREDIQNAVAQIREMLDKHPGIATVNTKYEHKHWHAPKLVSKDDHDGVKRTLLVYIDEFGDSSINILVYCYSKSVVWHEWLAVKEEVMLNIMEIFEKNNLEFAFPSLSLYHETEACSKSN